MFSVLVMKTKFILLIIAVVILPICEGREHTGTSFHTPLNVFFKFTCDPKQGLYIFNGENYDSQHHYDRTFTFTCKNMAQKENNCYWTHFLNDISGKLDFNCPDGYFIGGILSHHHNRPSEDRTWSVRCCKNLDVDLLDCKKTHDWTAFRDPFKFVATANRIITGLESELGHRDRKWRFYHCFANAKVRTQSKVCEMSKAIMRFKGNFIEETLDREWKFECSSHDIVNRVDDNCYWSAMANYLDKPLHYRCKSNFYINAIESYARDYHKDRVYNFRCCSGQDFRTYGCKLTDNFINNFRDDIDYPTNGKIILGIESYHDNTKEDRRWKLETCEYGRRIRTMECPSGEGIYKIRSSYNNDMHDRDWTYECRKIGQSFDYCYWTDYIDYIDGYFKTDCQVLTGMESLYNVNLKRRVWKVRCCSSKNLVPAECVKTIINREKQKGEMNYEVNGDAIVTGLESQFKNDDEKRDPVWKVSTCRFIEQPNLSFDCGTNNGLSYIKSEFFNSYNDRIWTFGCTKVSEAGFENCDWLSINKADMPIRAKCPDYQVIVSGKSTYSNSHGDRQWSFQCCKPKGNNFIVKKENCVVTPYMNSFQAHLEITLKPNHVITGLESYHENNYEDRRWKATVCEFECCGGK